MEIMFGSTKVRVGSKNKPVNIQTATCKGFWPSMYFRQLSAMQL